MRRALWLIPFFCVQLLLPLFGTGDSLNYLTLKDTIFLSIGTNEEKVFEHQIEKKQTLFSLAKFYGLSVEELYYYNPGLKDRAIQPGEKIRIPIPNRAIKRYRDATFVPWTHVPVYYVVRKGDNLFRISRFFFQMPIDTLMHRNQLSSTDLKTGQYIHVGWMSVDGIPESLRDSLGGPLDRKNDALRKIFLQSIAGKPEIQHQGVAFWQKDSKEDSDLYALHRHAPINAIIEITNPMKDRIVYAKVIGRIPDTAYRDDVVVVLSPLAAKMLGAKDPRFFVRVKYFR